MKHSSSRRFFLKTLALTAAAVVMAPVMKIQSVFAGEVPENDPVAKALGYHADIVKAEKADGKLKDRKDKKAFCKNCQFYQGDAKAATAKCQLISSGEVRGSGWCRSYSVKAKA